MICLPFFNALKRYLYNLKYQFIRRDNIVFCRVACLGKDIVKLHFGRDVKLINHQKLRIDVFVNSFITKQNPLLNSRTIEKHMFRKDIYPLIENQEKLNWDNYFFSSRYVVIDSYSELTDQLFKSKKHNFVFCSNYSDINHTDAFYQDFECQGLLNTEDIFKYYVIFMDFFRKKYPKKIIVLIFFPVLFDTREKFLSRGKEILCVFKRLEKMYNFVKLLELDDSVIRQSDDDDFPYHMSSGTVKAFERKFCELKRN